MKNAKIFSFVRVSERSVVASVRIAKWLQEYLDIPVAWQEDIAERPLDVLIIVNGAFAFCKHLAALGEAVQMAKKIVWVQNDYTIGPIPKPDSNGMSPFRRAFRLRADAGNGYMDFWSTCAKYAERKGSSYINWNMLTFDPAHCLKNIAKRRSVATNDLFYYGSFRNVLMTKKMTRVPLFDRYFKQPHAATVISSTSPKFLERYPECQHRGVVDTDFYDHLGKHGLGLYLEDLSSSEAFHSPANRFYEMLSAGLPMVFQPECGPMLRRAGYDPTPYVVNNARQVVHRMEERERIGAEQRERWISDPREFRAKLQEQVDAAIGRLA